MRASIGTFFERRLPLPFETGIIINIDLVPYFGNVKKALANSVDPDETPHDAASHQGLRCLLKGISVMLDGQELLKYDSVVNPSLARKVAFWFGTSADYAMIRRIEFTKTP
ncbi:hypothetical protein DPMN_134407 [Dreissena polymorpha]|uniref:Uncharacterized protein n=1 Tax=Dreissena polymorpha TaxID=45954 RepID=A0A9D4FW60_DREPO|nr:hypothetical protein DPMN_134407 [Dreissena polymorpha]